MKDLEPQELEPEEQEEQKEQSSPNESFAAAVGNAHTAAPGVADDSLVERLVVVLERIAGAVERASTALEEPVESEPLNPNYAMLAGMALGWADWLEEALDKDDLLVKAQSLRDLLENIRGSQRKYEERVKEQDVAK